MLRSIAIAGGARIRAAHLLTAALVLGGLVLGPVAHVQPAPASAGVETSRDGHPHGDAPAPDAHHDCPVCLTLASGAAPDIQVVSGSRLSDARLVAVPATAAHDRGVSDTERARAPPKL